MPVVTSSNILEHLHTCLVYEVLLTVQCIMK
uniref:Uncharacterized protein n=1 Tax=Arundo donax TaxID=35708 RepID=A0A0A8Z464_ARUDO